MSTIDERRRQRRLCRDDKLLIQILSASESPELVGEILTCTAVDVSRSGLRLEVAHEAPVGSDIDLWIDVKGYAGKYFLHGCVVWCYEFDAESKDFYLGVEIQAQTSTDYQEWQQLVAELDNEDV